MRPRCPPPRGPGATAAVTSVLTPGPRRGRLRGRSQDTAPAPAAPRAPGTSTSPAPQEPVRTGRGAATRATPGPQARPFLCPQPKRDRGLCGGPGVSGGCECCDEGTSKPRAAHPTLVQRCASPVCQETHTCRHRPGITVLTTRAAWAVSSHATRTTEAALAPDGPPARSFCFGPKDGPSVTPKGSPRAEVTKKRGRQTAKRAPTRRYIVSHRAPSTRPLVLPFVPSGCGQRAVGVSSGRRGFQRRPPRVTAPWPCAPDLEN